MSRRGWAGSPPADDDEARARIIEAAMGCIDRSGAEQFSLSDVAAELGVIRQTVYRYFPSTEHLFSAVGEATVDGFTTELTRHLEGITDPAEWVVEAVAATIERLPTKRHLTLLLASGRADTFARGVTSAGSMAISRRMFERSSVDWTAAGFDGRALDELEELVLRLIQSMIVAPPDPPRSSPALRAFLRRWVAPAVVTIRR